MLATKQSSRQRIYLTIAALSLFLGLINYILFQPGISLFVFLNIKPSGYNTDQILFQKFLSGHLSDIAWCISLYLCVLALAEKFGLKIPDKLALLFLPFLTEILQGFHLVYGTFDWYDMFTYLIVLAIFLLFFPQLIFNKHEKS